MPIERHPNNPILTRSDVPDVYPQIVDATSVFNPGAIRHRDGYRLVLRVQTRGRETVTMLADSDDGVRFHVLPRTIEVEGLEALDVPAFHVYDFRTTFIENEIYAVFSVDTDEGCRLGVARMPGGNRLELVGPLL